MVANLHINLRHRDIYINELLHFCLYCSPQFALLEIWALRLQPERNAKVCKRLLLLLQGSAGVEFWVCVLRVNDLNIAVVGPPLPSREEPWRSPAVIDFAAGLETGKVEAVYGRVWSLGIWGFRDLVISQNKGTPI